MNISPRQKLHSFSSIMHSDALLAERDTLSCAILQEHGDVSVFQLLLCLCFHYSCWELRSVDVQYTNVWTKTESSGELEGQHTCTFVQVGVKEVQEPLVDNVRWQALVFKLETHHDMSCTRPICLNVMISTFLWSGQLIFLFPHWPFVLRWRSRQIGAEWCSTAAHNKTRRCLSVCVCVFVWVSANCVACIQY